MASDYVRYVETSQEEIPDAPGQAARSSYKRTRARGELQFDNGYVIRTQEVGWDLPDSGLRRMEHLATEAGPLRELTAELGLNTPNGVIDWRTGQAEAASILASLVMGSVRSSLYLDAPTGTGKSILAMLMARQNGSTAIATSTINLQEQYAKEFNIPSITGRSNWNCDLTKVTADKALCTSLISATDCPIYKKGECDYYTQRDVGVKANAVVTNFQFWLNSTTLGGHRTIIDEAHLMEKELRSFQTLRNIPILADGTLAYVLKRQLSGLAKFPSDDDRTAWAKILQASYAELADNRGSLITQADTMRITGEITEDVSPELESISTQLRLIARQLSRLSLAGSLLDYPHIKDIVDGRFLTMEPLVGLMNVVPQMMMSATLVDPSLTDNGAYLCLELPSTFPKENRPVISFDTVRLSKASGDAGIKKLAWKLDQLMLKHSEEKGIVHCVSYSLADALKQASAYPSLIITHQPGGRDEAIQRFKEAPMGRVLLSPSITQGVDLPYDLCRWQLIAKVPFVNLGDRVERARMEQLPDLADLDVARQLVQMSGRGMRAEDDKCVTYIADGNFRWFYKKHFKLFPQWFREAVRFEND